MSRPHPAQGGSQDPGSVFHLTHMWADLNRVSEETGQREWSRVPVRIQGSNNSGHANDDNDNDNDDDDDDSSDSSDDDQHEVELQFSIHPSGGEYTIETMNGGDGDAGRIRITSEQLFRLLGTHEINRILRGQGVLPPYNGYGFYDWFPRQPAKRPGRGGPSLYPKVPSEEGRNLMASGDFGNEPDFVDRLVGRNSTLSAKLMFRELGTGPRGVEKQSLRSISQDLLPGTPADTIIRYDNPCYSGQFSDDGNFFFASSQDFKVRMYDTSNPYDWRHYKTVEYPFGKWTITDATLSPDNRFLAYSSIKNIVCLAGTDPSSATDPLLLDFDSSTQHMSPDNMRRPPFGIWSVRFSGDGREIVAGTSCRSVIVYDIETGQNVLQLQKHSDDVNAVCYGDKTSPHILYSGSDDSTIRIWDRRSMADGREAGVFVGHTEGVTFVDSKGDGRYVLSNSKDQTMKLWDLRKMVTTSDFNDLPDRNLSTGFDYRFSPYAEDDYLPHPDDCSVVTFRGHGVLRTLIRCYFSPPGSTNSRYVYTGSHDGKAYIYNLDATIAKVIDVSHVTRNTWKNDGYNYKAVRTCVRDVSWHPDAPIIVATSWNGWGMEDGTCTVHSWADGASYDEGEPAMGRVLESELQPVVDSASDDDDDEDS